MGLLVFYYGLELRVQREDLQRVMEFVSVREHHARTLLIHYRWDIDKLFEVYVEKGKSRMFSEAGVSAVEFVDLDPPESSSKVMCLICMDDMPAKDMTKMDCGHCFCKNCKHLFLHLDYFSGLGCGTWEIEYLPKACSAALHHIEGCYDTTFLYIRIMQRIIWKK